MYTYTYTYIIYTYTNTHMYILYTVHTYTLVPPPGIPLIKINGQIWAHSCPPQPQAFQFRDTSYSLSDVLFQIVLIGDHKQLRPIVKNVHVRRMGMAKSLFERYHTMHKKSAVMLDTQYRMVRTFINTSTVHGKYKYTQHHTNHSSIIPPEKIVSIKQHTLNNMQDLQSPWHYEKENF